MRTNPLGLVKRFAEFEFKDNVHKIPGHCRGLYVLYKNVGIGNFDVVYVAKATRGFKRRLKAHVKSERKRDQWTHFSVYEVQPEVSNQQIAELKGLLRHVHRKDSRASALNIQRSFRQMKIAKTELDNWRV